MFLPATWRRSILWAVCGTFLITFVFIHQITQTMRPIVIGNNEFIYYDLEKEEPIHPEQKCQFPRIHPFDQSILNYLSQPKVITCKERIAPLTYIDDNALLRFNLTAVKSNGYLTEKLNCDYSEIIRKNDFEVEYAQPQILSINGSLMKSDFVYVSCYNFAGIAFYTNVHCHILPKKKIINSWHDFKKNHSMYNALIIGIDSLSRLSFIRNLPKTYKFLTKNLEAFVFRGMTKVGDNTFPNLAAILTGKKVLSKELPYIENPTGTYDVWPCIWKNFTKSGYATLYAEDRPDISLFNYLRGGLRDPPTDHYMRPFWLAVQNSKLHRLSSNLCFGSIPKHKLQLQYVKSFVKKYSKENCPYFGFSFMVELSHDYASQVASADDDLELWLKDLLHSGHLNRTLLIFLSDHGHRFDSMRATLVGRIEERMPFYAMVVPKTILNSKTEVANNLKINQGRLTTPYDIYYTALDILNFSENNSELGSTTSSRGTSLFGYISPNRTCSSAGIPDHYCTCETEKEVDTSDPKSRKAASTLISSINNLLQSHGNFCSDLSLSEIIRADLIVASREVIVNSRIYFGKLVEDGEATHGMFNKMRVIVRTVPGSALFEGTVLFREDDGSVSVLGDISRINKYGTQSACIEDAVLRKYCYCKDLLDH